MSWVTILWSMVASACLTLAGLHLLVWVKNRRAWGSLAFAVAALGAAGTAAAEYLMMRAATPEEFGAAIRWANVPVAFVIWGIVWFVQVTFRTGRAWLALLAAGMRLAALILSFTPGPTVVYRAIKSLRQIEFLGEPVSVVAEAVPSPWVFLPVLANVVLLVFVVDATVRLWRVGGEEIRRRALLVGGSIVGFILVAAVFAALINQQVVHLPYPISAPFVAILAVMAYELSRDLLQASRLSEDLRESEHRLNLAAAAADLGLWFWNVRTDVLWATDRAREIFGFSSGTQLSFETWLARVVPEDRSSVEAAVAETVAGKGTWESEHRIRRPDGEVRWLSARGEVMREAGGKPSYLTGVVRDTTDRRLEVLETQSLRRDLAHSGRVTLLGQLSSALAHELSQPLGAILRNAEAAELMLEEPSPDLEELRAIVIDIRRDEERAGEVIHRLRSLLKRKDLEVQPVELPDLIAEVVSLVRTDAVVRGVTLRASVAPDVPAVLGDRVHLQQVLLNLIVNGMDALDASARDRRCVTVEARPVGGNLVEVAVSDDGPGIPEGALSRLFDPFFTTKANGLGVGLAMAKTIVEAHRGRIWAENLSSGGAAFRFTVPAAENVHGD